MLKTRSTGISSEKLYRPRVAVGDNLELVGSKMFTIKVFKLKWAHKSFPTALGLTKVIFQSNKATLRKNIKLQL